MKAAFLIGVLVIGLVVLTKGATSGNRAKTNQGGLQILAEIELNGTTETFLIKYKAAGRAGQLEPQDVHHVIGMQGNWEQPPELYDLYGDGKLEPAPRAQSA